MTEPLADLDISFGHKNMQQLIQLRWIAVVGQIVTIAIAVGLFQVPLPLWAMGATVLFLAIFNAISHVRWRESPSVSSRALFVALLVDVAALTWQLYWSGGLTNPFAFIYLLQVILGAVLLKSRWSWCMVGVTVLALTLLAWKAEPLGIPLDHDHGWRSLYNQGLLVCFALNAGLLAWFIRRINDNLRQRDAKLAALRQQAIENEHIVRMGLLASGAAHELGTPLATLSVIVGDWQRMPVLQQNSELRQEVEEMQQQLQRCKRIVSGILLSAGEARGEGSQRTTLGVFLQGVVERWQSSRHATQFRYSHAMDGALAIAGDSMVEQMLCNLLDNALEASPQGQHLHVEQEMQSLVLTVRDQGPGFPVAILQALGKPYQSTKGRAGSGLGLFLVSNVVRTLEGQMQVHNLPEGGALVRLSIPLSALTI
ncbi:ATP-binding protein [Curvibacter sp. CHRR-16]|uniref:ATP-binding protein n=1 Tax=Curvibacter sp. CHRR-16 TaxID=2835872 RepID=UPI00202398F6|nr:ATP-binding protein [Curvibacter sp. CHRR-16]